MIRLAGWLLLLGVGIVGCGPETDIPPGSGGAGGTSPTTTGGAGSAGTPSGGGQAGGASGGAPAAGSGGQTGGGGGQAGAGGAQTGGGGQAGGSGGASGGGGQAGAGGEGNPPMLPKRVLLYHFSTLSIASVPAQITLLKSQLEAWSYEVEESVDPAAFSATNLARFGAVGMINTCFEPFGAGKSGTAEAAALKTFVEGGGGLFGTHCASVTFQNAQPPHAYNALLGGRGGKTNFEGKSTCRTVGQHPTTMQLPATFEYTGNLDDADYVATDSTVLVKCQWSGGAQRDATVSWVRSAGKGRVFFTNFAKEDDDLSDATLGAKHILVGLGWVLGR